jgi:tRNA pseudouridine32 synthase/23S rRNA pseudouridine746 synthase
MRVTLFLVGFPEVIFENDDFLALNKPAGWFSIPAREPKTEDQVLTEWIKSTHKTEAWVIHRLDRFTSGIILFAKNQKAQRDGNIWFQDRKVKKTYQFLASPPPRLPAIQIREPVEGKPAQTLFEVIQKNEFAFFGKATPMTGRFHQIRAHAAAGGFPLLGDLKYDGKTTLLIKDEVIGFPRFCLHAFELQLPFGIFRAELPEDLTLLKGKLFT